MNQQIYQDVHLEEQPTTNVHQESNQEQYMDQGADQMQNMDQQIHQDVHLDEQPTPNVHQESDQEQYVDRGADQIQNMNKQIHHDVHLGKQPTQNVHQESDQGSGKGYFSELKGSNTGDLEKKSAKKLCLKKYPRTAKFLHYGPYRGVMCS